MLSYHISEQDLILLQKNVILLHRCKAWWLGDPVGTESQDFSKKLLLMTPLRKKIKEQGCETADPLLCSSCDSFTKIEQSVGGNEHLSITKEYLLHSWRLSYFPPPADLLPFSAACTSFPCSAVRTCAIVPIYFAELAKLSICLSSSCEA